MRAVDFLLLCFASFRLARLAIEDTFTQPIRDAIFRRWPGENVEYQPKEQGRVRGGTVSIVGKIFAAEPTWLGDRLSTLLSCYACTGFWTSLLLAAGWLLSPTVTFWISLPFGISGGVWLIAVAQEYLEEKADS